jgi:hypothetical protein
LNIYFSDHFLKKVKGLPDDVKRGLREKLGLFAENPSHPSLRTKEIKGHNEIFESSVTMSVRMTWEYYKDGVLLRNIGEHDKTLKKP